MVILDGKKVSEFRRQILSKKIDSVFKEKGVKPGLAVILVGDNPASKVYVAAKARACQEVGIVSFEHHLSDQADPKELESLIHYLNQDPAVHGILVQLPLPQGFDSDKALSFLSPEKDVDGLKLESMGALWLGRPLVVPCTPAGIMALLDFYQIPVAGKNAVVVGRSNIVGKPMAQLLTQADATVTVCHSRTPDLGHFTRSADIVVVAAGRPRFLGKEDFKPGAVIIDVGIHRLPAEKSGGRSSLCGDVRFEELDHWASAATPVPGGVGPMTITLLLENVFHLCLVAKEKIKTQ